MAGASNSDDDSGIFWPGYVDAVTNLAINLLFVIAVMALSILAAVLQIGKMKDADSRQQLSEQQSEQDQMAGAQANDKASQQMANAQARLASLSGTSSSASEKTGVAEAQKDDGEDIIADAKTSDVVLAQSRKLLPNQGSNRLVGGASSGITVVFSSDVIDLSDDEQKALLQKLGGSVGNQRWQLRVLVPKGFSEASRIGFYRLSSIRNILIANGVKPANIEVRLIETASKGANNARVQVRPAP